MLLCIIPEALDFHGTGLAQNICSLLGFTHHPFPARQDNKQEMDFSRPLPLFRGRTAVSIPSSCCTPEGKYCHGGYSVLCFGKERGAGNQASHLRALWFRSHSEHIAIHHYQLIPTDMIQTSSRHVIKSRSHIVGFILADVSQNQNLRSEQRNL